MNPYSIHTGFIITPFLKSQKLIGNDKELPNKAFYLIILNKLESKTTTNVNLKSSKYMYDTWQVIHFYKSFQEPCTDIWKLEIQLQANCTYSVTSNKTNCKFKIWNKFYLHLLLFFQARCLPLFVDKDVKIRRQLSNLLRSNIEKKIPRVELIKAWRNYHLIMS